MQNFLETIDDADKCRSVIFKFRPAFQWGRMDDRWWTTGGELDKFCAPVTGCVQRLDGVLKPLLKEDDLLTISIADDAEYLALQMGKHQSAFSAPMKIRGHIHAISPRAALLAMIVHRGEKADQMRSAFGFPNDKTSITIKAITKAIETGKPDPSWGVEREIVSIAIPVKPAVLEEKPPQVFGELSGLLQVCFAEEQRARERYESLLLAVDSAKSALDEAGENTKAVVRATEIAERLK